VLDSIMYASAAVFPPLSPTEALRAALMRSLIAAHRPELADFLSSADLKLELPGIWIWPEAAFGSVSPAWLEPRLLAAAIESGLPLEWIRVLETGPREQGREA
jgi:hypothetical protein